MPSSLKMSAPDSAWLRMENRANPMTISGVMTTGAPMSREQVVRMIEERLLAYGRFAMCVDNPRARRPRWVPEEPFDIDRHVLPYNLPAPGDQDALERAVSDLMSTPLSFAAAPWTIHHVERYGGGSALIVRLHHCIADGIAMMHVLLSMSDEMWNPESVVPRPSGNRRRSVGARFRRTASGAASELTALISRPSHLASRARSVGGGTWSLAALLAMRPDSNTQLKSSATPRKRAAWSRPIDLDELKAVGRATGTKINDVLMAAAAGGLRRYLEARGKPVNDVEVRAAVPFNVRPKERAHELGNQFSLVFVKLPVGLERSAERLKETKARMDAVKDSSEPAVVFGILQSIGFAPEWMHRLVVKMFSEKCSTVITNVPGPQEQLHLMGVPVDSLMFWVPQAGDIGLGISILSLNGRVTVGVAADAGIMEDPNPLVEAFEAELDALVSEYVPSAEA